MPKSTLSGTSSCRKSIKSAKGSKQTGYDYTELSKCEAGADKVNFYGIIVDAQFPHKSFKSDKYVCSVKITDQSCPIDPETGVVTNYTLVLFAKHFEDLPISQRVGDIIRVHRATVGNYHGKTQFTANIFFNASWAIFPPSQLARQPKEIEFRPFQFFGKSLSFDSKEKQIVRELRKWILHSFQDHRMVSVDYITKLAALSTYEDSEKRYDFDLQVKIVQFIKLDRYTSEISVLDSSNEIWHAQILNQKFKWLQEGQFVRIRQASLQNHKSYQRVFGLKSSSNILILPEPSVLTNEMNINEKDLVANHEMNTLTNLECQDLKHPVLISEIESKEDRDLHLSSMLQLLNDEHIKRQQTLGLQSSDDASDMYRVRFQAVAVNPPLPTSHTDLASTYLRVFNEATGSIRELQKSEKTDKKFSSKSGEKLCLQFQFIAKDASLADKSDFAIVNLLHVDKKNEKANLANFLTGFDPAELLQSGKKSQDAAMRLHFALSSILRFGVFIEACLTVQQQQQAEEQAKSLTVTRVKTASKTFTICAGSGLKVFK